MSKMVTFEQAKKLKELRFNVPTLDYFREHDSGLVSEFSTSYAGSENWNAQQRKVYSRPTVSSALDWVREEKGIECGVYPIMIPIRDGLSRMAYAHSAFDLNNNCKRLQLDISLVKIDTHPLASSALLDAVLTYLEQNTTAL